MTDNGRDRIDAVEARFKAMEIDTGDPKWSSWVLDRMLEGAVSAPGGSLRDVYAGLDAALKDYSVRLTETVAQLIRDVVVKGFTQHRSAYEGMDWGWAIEELAHGPSPVRCYLFLHALPPESATPSACVAILRGLEGTDYHQEGRNMLSDSLDRTDGSAVAPAGRGHAAPRPQAGERTGEGS
jgi:hypothetical protein